MGAPADQASGMSSTVVELSGLYRFSAAGLPVILVSDHATVDAARPRLLDYEVCSWNGDIERVDWSPLIGNPVFVWPTNSSAAIQEATKLGERLHQIGITSGFIIRPDGQPPAWTLADAVAERINIDEFANREDGRHLRPLSITKSVAVGAEPKPEGSTLIALKKLGFADGKIPPSNEDTVDTIMEGTNMPFWYDEFLQRVMTTWRSDVPRAVTDGDLAMLTVHLQRTYGLSKMSPAKVRSGLDYFLQRHRRNSAQEALRALVWDGEVRLPGMLARAWGTEKNAYYSAVGRCWIMGMVNRVLNPGCQFDNFPLFEGGEGVGKSTALRIIGGEYFSECHESIMSKDFQQMMHGKMLLEIAELHSFKRAEIERIKGIISNRVDTYRPSYGRIAQDFPRSCSFAGTTNRNDWNISDTGMRRAWRIIVGKVDLYWLRVNRDQLLAEAVARLDMGEVYHDVPDIDAKALQDDARVEDPWTDAVLHYARAMPQVTPTEILSHALIIDIGKQTPGDVTRVRSILKLAGFVSSVRRIDGITQRTWRQNPVGDDVPF